MSNDNVYVTTAIPYVNGEPHLGHALELVQADVIARHQRLRGRPVRFLTGTDDNALKNATAAQEAGIDVREFVDANAARFAALHRPLSLSVDDFIRTGSDPRHPIGVEALWRRCAARGDVYRHRYTGLYCPGCEQFYATGELVGGVCPEHGVAPDVVTEENWFFRLSRYAEDLLQTLESGRVRVEPPAKRNEVLAFIRAGLDDFSISRPAERAGGWGIAVPDDPTQVVYVWLDALANYITALGYGTDRPEYRDWWVDSAERVQVIGKGIIRFHAVYWLAILLSAGEPLPTTIVVHDYLSANGAKIAKSTGNAADPVDLVERYGVDAVRWWLLSEVPPVGDTDFTEERLVARGNLDLAHGVGNLVNRTLAQVHKFRAGRVPDSPDAPASCATLAAAVAGLPGEIDRCVRRFDFRAATVAVCAVVDEGNRLIEAERPWDLARIERAGDAEATRRLDAVLAILVGACRVLAGELAPLVPDGSRRLRDQLGRGTSVGRPEPAFTRLEATSPTPAGRPRSH